MKNIFKILGITAIITAIGFSITACGGGSDYSVPEPKTFITVTDIPSAYNGMIGALVLYPSDSLEIAVYSTEEKISGNSTVFPLFNYADEAPWEGSGSFRIAIIIFQDVSAAASGQREYSGIIAEDTSITETTTVISWASFAQRSNIKYHRKVRL